MVFTFGLIHGVLQLRKQLIRKRPFRLVKAPLTGIIALCALLLMVLTGLRFIRKNLYQLFLVAHIVGYVTAIVALWMHTPATQPYLAFVIAVIGFDFLVTIIKSRFKRAIFTAMPDGLTRIEVQGINNGWRPGQHVYIRVLRARFFFEKHPFTIANAPSSSSPHGSTNYMLLVVKAVGDFTKRIHKIGQAPQKPSEFLVDINDDKTVQKPEFKNNFDNFNEAVSGITHYVIVDGPYGSSFTDLTKYKNVLLCAGGSGFTYCMTALEDIVGEAARGGRSITRNIVLVWSLREPAMLESFESTLVNTIAVGFAKNINIDFRLFITTQAGSNFRPKLLPKTIIKISTQKPDLYQIVDELIDSQSNIFIEDIVGVEDGRRCGSGLGIGVCGPVNMVDQMKDVVLKLDTERFRQAGGVTLHS
ncbi:hypothetical protein BY996DRAFT_7210406 [Phakopsora pachyrhizi]|nr:hypothetical protein BY996DRAFT_7210406 [Phakopsora pachyrhizi]